MKQYTKYQVDSEDIFNPENFSPVTEEIATIKEKTDRLPSIFKSEIILSFAKEHSLQNDWIKANPVLTSLVTSGLLFQGAIESLFESSKDNPLFRQGLEKYLKQRFANSQS